MSLLERYLARAVLSGTLMVLAVLVALSGFVLFVSEGAEIGRGSYTLLKATLFVLASMPLQAYQLFPMAVLMGSLLGLGQLAAGNELTVIRVSGVSVWRMARMLLVGAVTLTVLVAALGEFLAPNAERYAQHLRSVAISQRLTVIDRQGLWAKDGNVFVNVRQMKEENELSGVYLYEFDGQGHLLRAAQAAGAVLSGGKGWQLRGVRETRLTPERTAVVAEETRDWKSGLDADLLGSLVVDYDSLSALALGRYSSYLRGNALDANDVDIYFWSRFAMPLNVLLMVMLALPFAFGPLRATGAGQRVVVGILVGIAFYAANKTLMHSGTVYGLDPLLTNFLPTVVLALATTVAIARVD